MGKKSRTRCSRRSKKKLLDFWDGVPRLTDFSSAAFRAVMPTICEYMPRIYLTMREHDIHCALNAIAYIAVFHTPWSKIDNMKVVQRFYYRLKKLGLLSLIRACAGLPSSLLINRPTERTPGEKGDKVEERPRMVCRPCGPCPRCGADTMHCYGSHKVGALRVRHYRCRTCRQTAVWITGANHSWWKNPNQLAKLAKKFPTCG